MGIRKAGQTMAIQWKKSSFSGADNQCVEIAHTRNAVRDSKNGAVLSVSVSRLLAVVKAGHLSH
jgi:hypothetical protein